MTVKVGDTLPSGSLAFMGDNGPESITTDELCNGKKIVLFAVPGAFTPTCSESHLPGFVANADKILAKGVDRIVCMSVNDPFVMGAWGKSQNAEHLMMAADGSATFTKALGLELDLVERGLGIRSQRFSMIVDNGTITHLNVEEGPVFEVSSAENILQQL
jgi:peroxiredoxin